MCMPSDNSQSLCFAKIKKKSKSETKICCCCSNKFAALTITTNNNFKKCLHKETKKRLKIQSSSTILNLKSKEKYIKLKKWLSFYLFIRMNLHWINLLINFYQTFLMMQCRGLKQADHRPHAARQMRLCGPRSTVKTGRFDEISPIVTINFSNCCPQKLFY